MRRNRISSGSSEIFRKGVMHSVNTRKRRAQAPVWCCRNSTGLGVRSACTALHTRKSSGPSESTKTATFAQLLERNLRSMNPSVELLQVHARIQRRHLVRVSVEHQRLSHEKFAQPPLRGLAPARMIHVGIHIRIKSVLIRRIPVPRGRRLGSLQPNLHDGLNALVAILPRHHYAHRRAVLIRQRLAVHAYAQQRQRVHRFIQPQPFHVLILYPPCISPRASASDRRSSQKLHTSPSP